MSRALVALGGNIAPRRARLEAALAALERLPGTRVVRRSRWIETAPVEAPPGSSAFINGACLLETGLGPVALLEALLEIERAAGRVRLEPNGPRTVDLDLVLHDEHVLDTPELSLPHPRAHLRAFVLEPAAEIAAELRHPRLDATIGELAARLRERETVA